MIKKIHSAMTLILCAVALVHMGVTGLLMGHVVKMHLGFLLLAYGLFFVMIAHIAFTFISMMFNRGGNAEKSYVKLNASYYIQRISAVLLVVLMPAHFTLFSHNDVPWAEKMLAALSNPGMVSTLAKPVVMPNMFFLIATVALAIFCCVHIAISIPKALVGLGVLVEEKTVAIVGKISFVCVFAVGAVAIWGSFVMASFSGLFGSI